MTEYQITYKGQVLESGTLLDCEKEMMRRFGWMTVADAILIGVRIEPKN